MKTVTISAYSPGDPSVGIFPGEWKIENVELEIDASEDREKARKDFREAFLWIADDIQVNFSDDPKEVEQELFGLWPEAASSR